MEEQDIKYDTAMAFADAEKGEKRWALMLFYTEMEMGVSNNPNKWVNTANIYYDKGIDALNAYANTRCPASQLVDGETTEELTREMEDMIEHYKDEKWLEENLYPYM